MTSAGLKIWSQNKVFSFNGKFKGWGKSYIQQCLYTGMLGKKERLEKNDTWCTILINEFKTKVQVRHLGGGKFKVVNDESEGSLIGKELDASEIFHC